MTRKTFSESFSKTFSKGVRTAMHLKWPSYLILLENLHTFEPETGRESPDSDPRLQFQVATGQRVAEARGGSASESASEIKTAIRLVQYRSTTGQPLETTGFAARSV
jgi:hypothetical protein